MYKKYMDYQLKYSNKIWKHTSHLILTWYKGIIWPIIEKKQIREWVLRLFEKMLIISIKVSCDISTNVLKINTLIGSLYPMQILSLIHLFGGLNQFIKKIKWVKIAIKML